MQADVNTEATDGHSALQGAHVVRPLTVAEYPPLDTTLCLVETWLRPTDEVYIGLPHDVLSLEAPKSGRPHGGIVLLRRPGLQTRVLAKYATKSYQLLAVHVKPGLNIIGVYITPNAKRTAIH